VRVAISDCHFGDPDLRRYVTDATGGPASGAMLLGLFSVMVEENGWRVDGVGDIFNYCGRLSEALVEYGTTIERFQKAGMTLWPGNHDRRNAGAIPLQTLRKQFNLVYVHDADPPYCVGVSHWHQHDPVWSKPGWLRKGFGEAVIKNGLLLETHVHPLIDETIIKAVKAPLNWFMKRGNRIEDEYWISKVVEEAKRTEVEVALGGHTHRMGWWVKNGIEVVNLGSAIPRTIAGGIETIVMGVWNYEERQLYQMTLDGLMPAAKVHL